MIRLTLGKSRGKGNPVQKIRICPALLNMKEQPSVIGVGHVPEFGDEGGDRKVCYDLFRYEAYPIPG